jgi:DNA-directed RNA polymerase subunit K/omega
MSSKANTPAKTTVTRNIKDLTGETGNIYESLAIISRRADQLTLELKEELSSKLQEFATAQDNLEEVFENREQIEISRHYEKLPKSHAIAVVEFVQDKIYWRDPALDVSEENA